MLEHLIENDFEPPVRETGEGSFVGVSRTNASDLLQAQANTADFLVELGLTEAQVLQPLAQESARQAFAGLVNAPADAATVEILTELKIPEQVRMVTGMLTAYDWEFVNQAKELRSLVVTRLVHEATFADKAGDRIKALTALGKVTEVGLFTEKIEVKKTEQTDEELDSRIKERLAKLRGVMDALPRPSKDVSDVATKADEPDA